MMEKYRALYDDLYNIYLSLNEDFRRIKQKKSVEEYMPTFSFVLHNLIRSNLGVQFFRYLRPNKSVIKIITNTMLEIAKAEKDLDENK